MELGEEGLFLVAQLLFLQGGGDAGPKHDRVEGLGHEVLGPGFDAAHGAFHVVQRRQHDDRNVPQPLVGLDEFEHTEAVQFGHDDVEQDKVIVAFVEGREGGPAVANFGHRVAEFLQAAAQHLTIDHVIIHHEQAGRRPGLAGGDKLGGGVDGTQAAGESGGGAECGLGGEGAFTGRAALGHLPGEGVVLDEMVKILARLMDAFQVCA